ncbi:MAG: DUF3179 domain-containing protein [Gammaproteobacteria bacterium]|nr:DUF3179 domain-containing protein [Gammaproteobacteria bacterium]
MLTSKKFVAACLLVAMLIAAIGFIVLADLTQFVVEVPRWVTMFTHSIRMELFWVGVLAMAIGYVLGRKNQLFSKRVLNWTLAAFLVMALSGYINPPFLMFRTQQHDARFISIEQLRKIPQVQVQDSDEVFVVEINGDARAYPLDWMAQPHVAGDTIGGEEVALTFCSLSHLGMAVTPELNDQQLELKLLTQLQNNLVLYDARTNKPIQQIWASFEGEQSRMREWPTRVMTFEAYRALYPAGKVFFNPAYNPWNKLVRWMVYSVVGLQHAIEAPVFPTIHEFDTRLPNKAYVYGVRVGDTKVAFTRDYIERNGGMVNTKVDGKPLVLVYFEDYGFVDAFERTVGGEVITVTEIDPYGRTPQGQLERAVMASEVFWFIWSTFYPDTDVKA